MAKKSPPTPAAAPYSVHPGITMVQKWVAELPEKTGRTLEQWVAYIRESGPPTEKERRAWLKQAHGLGTNTAWWLAERASGGTMGMADEDPASYLREAPLYVDAMFAGPKAALRPIYDRLLQLGLALGGDVKICPCKTIVPFYRRHVIAEVKPSTRTRLDFGLALKDTPVGGRLVDTGGRAKGNRITHRIPLTSVTEIDAEVERWLRTAYDLDT